MSDGVRAWEATVRVHRTLTRTMDRSLRAAFGHSLDEYDVLHQLASAGEPIRMGDLAERLLVANSSCHRLVARLAETALVERVRGDQDRREVLVGLSAEGRRLHRRLAAHHGRDIEALFGARLEPDEQSVIETAFGRLADSAGP
jgi:DNA-binding MarR family transcriptional regulator